MRLKEIKSGMVIHCKTQEEANILCDHFGASNQWKEYWEKHKDDTCYQILSNGINTYGKSISYGSKIITEFSDLILPELTAKEVFTIMSEIHKEAYKKYSGCIGCPLCVVAQNCETDCFAENADKIIEICEQWKSDHEKKEPEIETVDICRIIEIQPDGRKRCVHEEDIKPDPELPFGSEQLSVGQILKRYCMEHDGEYIAVHEVISRVKEAK